MDDEVLQQLIGAVDAILNPNTSSQDRVTAHRICESFQQNEMSGLIGYLLASKYDAAQHIKHFGLQLMQQFICNNWAKVAKEIQIQTKNNAMSLVKDCRQHESGFVKHGIAKVLAEIVKHVWPQQWPTMVDDLIRIAERGPVQTELAELVFLRIAEDVALLQNVAETHRSRDIRHGLSLVMGVLMSFFVNVLENNSARYIQMLGTTNPSEIEEMAVYHCLSLATLKTLQGYLEWAGIEHIFANDGFLINIFCKLLDVHGLKNLAADCLTLVASRKGQPNEKKHTLSLTNSIYIEAMMVPIQRAEAIDEEEQYLFMKRMANLLSSLGSQIISCWNEENTECSITNLASHDGLLNALLYFFQHQNPVLACTVSSAWLHFVQHSSISKDEKLIEYVPRLLEISALGVRKHVALNLPVQAQLDFNDDEEAEIFMQSHRTLLLQIIRGCTRILPNHCVNCVMRSLRSELSLPIDTGRNDLGLVREQCTSTSPSFLRWDALRSILDIVFKSASWDLKENKEQNWELVQTMVRLLTDLVQFDVTDILLGQCLISFVSGFLPVMEVFGENKLLVIGIIQKYAKMIKLSVNHPDRWGAIVSQLKRHGLSAIIHLCKYHPASVMMVFNEFKNEMSELVSLPDGLTNLEKVCVYESLVLVSGEWNNFSQQSDLIGEAMALSSGMWPSKDDIRTQSTKDFATAIGLCSPASQYQDKQTASFRGDISFCVALIMAMINRSRVPDKPALQRSGGFLDSNGNVIHPCSPHILGYLENIAAIIQMFHGLWSAVGVSVVHKDYVQSLAIRNSERRTMVSFNPNMKDSDEDNEKEPWQRMQTFILIVLENCYQVLGGAGKCCNVQLYGSENLPVILVKTFSDMQTLPELRLRSLTRHFLYYFLKACPGSHEHSVVAPILEKFCRFMNSMLQAHWNEYAAHEQERLKVIASMTDRSLEQEDAKEEDEILKEQLLRVVSREYLEILVNLCVNKRPGIETNVPNTSQATSLGVTQLTSLGVTLMQNEVAEILLETALTALSWYDTTTSCKAVQLTWPLLKHAFVATPFMTDEAAKFIFEAALMGLQRQGQHDQGQLVGLCLYVFISLRPNHGNILAILESIPTVDDKELKAFDEGYTRWTEKKRKTAFKKIVMKIVEQHVGQRHKCMQYMKRLPKFFFGRKPKNLDIDEKTLGLELFFKPEKG